MNCLRSKEKDDTEKEKDELNRGEKAAVNEMEVVVVLLFSLR